MVTEPVQETPTKRFIRYAQERTTEPVQETRLVVCVIEWDGRQYTINDSPHQARAWLHRWMDRIVFNPTTQFKIVKWQELRQLSTTGINV